MVCMVKAPQANGFSGVLITEEKDWNSELELVAVCKALNGWNPSASPITKTVYPIKG